MKTKKLFGHQGSKSKRKTLVLVIGIMLGIFQAQAQYASGGAVATYGIYTVHTFTATSTFTVPSGGLTVDYLVVAGGGGGGRDGAYGGGGGAGGMRQGSLTLSPGSYTVTVGAGGNGTSSVGIQGGDGGNSIFSSITATGGGGGGANGNGRSGGSGGGASRTSGNSGGAGTGGQGNNGGDVTTTWSAGGGGGAGSVGGNGTASGGSPTGGNGGNGASSDISGTTITYAGGGGGGFNGTTGGTGGGGAGTETGTATSGTANTGGGGGGVTNGTSGNGGSGIIIIRYTTGPNWSIYGNTGTTASTSSIGSTVNNNFIGTTDAVDFVVATNNLERMRILSSGQALNISPFGSSAGNTGELRFSELTANGSNYVGLKSPDAISANKIWTLPNADGSSGQFLSTNGSGVLSWASVGGGTLSGGTTNYIPKWTSSSTLSSTSLLYEDGTHVGIGTTSPGALLEIKGASNATQFIIKANSTQSNSNPLIALQNSSGTNLLTINSDNVSNTFVGLTAGVANTVGAGSNGQYNTFIGAISGYSNTTGDDNTALGYGSFYNNVSGNSNAAIANYALFNNYSGYSNTAVGTSALHENYSGYYNTAAGGNALWSNYSGYDNTANGYDALFASTGSFNTAAGFRAGYTNTTGSYNTFLGYGADVSTYSFTNCGSIGNSSVVTAGDKIFMGDANLMGCYNTSGTWGSYSDARFKTNVREDVKGLEFIKQLRPVTYNMDTKKLTEFITQNMPDSIRSRYVDKDFSVSTNRIHSGFLAQEVEQASTACGFTSSIVSTPANSTDPYALSYAEFVVPLVKAVQELSHTVDSLLSITRGKEIVQKTSENATIQIELANNNQIILYQNEPNPFGDNTIIRYFIPDNITSAAFVIFYDMYGKEIQKTEILTKGFGNIHANTENLAEGIYSYSIIVNGKVIETKKMMRSK